MQSVVLHQKRHIQKGYFALVAPHLAVRRSVHTAVRRMHCSPSGGSSGVHCEQRTGNGGRQQLATLERGYFAAFLFEMRSQSLGQRKRFVAVAAFVGDQLRCVAVDGDVVSALVRFERGQLEELFVTCGAIE